MAAHRFTAKKRIDFVICGDAAGRNCCGGIKCSFGFLLKTRIRKRRADALFFYGGPAEKTENVPPRKTCANRKRTLEKSRFLNSKTAK